MLDRCIILNFVIYNTHSTNKLLVDAILGQLCKPTGNISKVTQLSVSGGMVRERGKRCSKLELQAKKPSPGRSQGIGLFSRALQYERVIFYNKKNKTNCNLLLNYPVFV